MAEYNEDTPKIYVADLKSYNEGNLVGEWIDLSEYDNGEEVQEKITELMEGYSKKYHDGEETEHAIHDYENFSSDLYSEYMGEKDFDTIIYTSKIAEEKDIDADTLQEIMNDYGVEAEDLEDWIDEKYMGDFDSEEELAEWYVEMVGGIDGVSNKEFYFDYEKLGRDLAINDYTNYGNKYFNNYKEGGKVDYAKGGKIDTLMVVEIEWKQLNDKGLGRYYIAEKDVEKLEDEYGSTYYFDYYDDSDDVKMRVPYAKMKKILDKEMKDKGLMDSYYAHGGKTEEYQTRYLLSNYGYMGDKGTEIEVVDIQGDMILGNPKGLMLNDFQKTRLPYEYEIKDTSVLPVLARGGKISKDDAIIKAMRMGVDFDKDFHAQSFGNELSE